MWETSTHRQKTASSTRTTVNSTQAHGCPSILLSIHFWHYGLSVTILPVRILVTPWYSVKISACEIVVYRRKILSMTTPLPWIISRWVNYIFTPSVNSLRKSKLYFHLHNMYTRWLYTRCTAGAHVGCTPCIQVHTVDYTHPWYTRVHQMVCARVHCSLHMHTLSTILMYTSFL